MRALAGEGGEVGGKALALLESWKKLVIIMFQSHKKYFHSAQSLSRYFKKAGGHNFM